MKRRSFLQLLGMAPAAAVTSSAERLAGIGVGGSAGLGFSQVAAGFTENLAVGLTGGENTEYVKAAAYLATNAVPSFVAERARDHVRHNVMRFDPDLASNRSFSLATKIRI